MNGGEYMAILKEILLEELSFRGAVRRPQAYNDAQETYNFTEIYTLQLQLLVFLI